MVITQKRSQANQACSQFGSFCHKTCLQFSSANKVTIQERLSEPCMLAASRMNAASAGALCDLTLALLVNQSH